MNRDLLALACLLLAFFARDACAQTTRQGGDALGRLQAVVQQLTAERGELQAAKSKLEAQLAESEKQLEASQAQNADLEAQLARAQTATQRAEASGTALEQRLADSRTRMDELVGRFRETATTLQQVEGQRGDLDQQLTERTRELDVCTERNVALYDTGAEILARYSDKSFWTVLGQQEPFTQIKRVQIENLADEYRTRLEDARYAGEADGDGA